MGLNPLTVKIISPGILFHILVEHDLNVVFHIVIWRIVMPGLVSHVLTLQFKHELQSFLFHWLIDSLFKPLIRLTNTKDTPSKPGITASLWAKSTGVFPGVSRIKVEYAHVITLSRSLPSLSPLRWRHNEHDSVSNHQPHDCLLNHYSGADQSKHQSSASLAFVWGIHRDRWIPRTNGQ